MATAEQKQDVRRLTVGPFRLSYPHLSKPSKMGENDALRYSIEMIFDKTGDLAPSLAPFKAAVDAAATLKFGADKAQWPSPLKRPFRDGDKPVKNKKTGKMEVKPEHVGKWVMRASTLAEYGAPEIRSKKNEVIDPSKFYAGCYAIANVLANGYSFGNNEGVSFILNGVQFYKDGTPFGGKPSGDQMFGVIEGDDDDATLETEELDDADTF